MGNRILKSIYHVLECHIHSNEIVARSENDHFFLCLHESQKQEIQKRLDNMIDEIHSLDQQNAAHLRIVQGACFIENNHDEINMIQDCARLACRIHGEQSQCHYYDKEIMETMKKEQELNYMFEDSIENQYFHMYLQPKVDLANHKICGAEALIRWIHPQLGYIYPSEFIPVFERNDNIIKLDLYIFEKTCLFIREWLNQHYEAFPISVNVSRRHFNDSHFLNDFYKVKEHYCIPDDLIELGIN